MINTQNLTWLLQLSRPRFWVYLFGPFIVGVAAGYNTNAGQLEYIPLLFLAAVFFTFPANLIIYGVNDLYDYETDKHNVKKQSYETLLRPKYRPLFVRLMALVTVPFIALLTAQLTLYGLTLGYVMLLGFLFFGIGYSAPPIRAKTKPFLDALFNVLYVFPGLFGYVVLAGELPPVSAMIAATAWVVAMHAFSAVPDIKADKKAQLRTIATVLGRENTIVLCACLYAFSASLVFQYITWMAIVGGVLYWALMVLAYRAKTDKELFAVYKRFPVVNMVFGAVLFFIALL